MALKIETHESVIAHVVSKSAHTKLAKIVVKDDKLIIDDTQDVGPDGLERSLEVASEIVREDDPCFLLCRVEGKSNTPRWCLILWLPETAAFEDRTTYANGRHALLSILGNAYFVEEIYCASRDTFDLGRFRTLISTSLRRKKSRNEIECDQQYNGFITKDFHQKQRPFPPLPFTAGEGFETCISDFAKSSSDCVVLTVNDENSTISAQKNREQSPSSIARGVYQREPRFYLVRYNNRIALCLYIPEGPGRPFFIPQRLLYASSKSAVINLLDEAGVNVWKSVDLRVPGDMNEAIFEDDLDAEFIPFASQKLRPKRKKRGSNILKLYPKIHF